MVLGGSFIVRNTFRCGRLLIAQSAQTPSCSFRPYLVSPFTALYLGD